jgi:hypothetical protein
MNVLIHAVLDWKYQLKLNHLIKIFVVIFAFESIEEDWFLPKEN